MKGAHKQLSLQGDSSGHGDAMNAGRFLPARCSSVLMRQSPIPGQARLPDDGGAAVAPSSQPWQCLAAPLQSGFPGISHGCSELDRRMSPYAFPIGAVNWTGPCHLIHSLSDGHLCQPETRCPPKPGETLLCTRGGYCTAVLRTLLRIGRGSRESGDKE